MTAETALHRWVQKNGIIQGGSSQLYALRKLFRPELYQGKYRRRRYFEGWYYKLIPAHRQEAWAVIAGVALGESRNERHAFIQLMDGAGRADYFTYPFHAFTFDPRRFVVHIGPNRFSDASLELALQGDQRRIQGAVRFSRIAKLHWRPWNPGIMGPFSFVPGMECYHGIVNLHHELQGQLLVAGAAQAFDAGYGYLEKDWGRSFPESWIWLQCNHFAEPGVSFMLSMAKIPWLGRHFLGIISCLRRGGREYRCATYTGGRVTEFSSSPDRWQLVVQDRRLHLQVDARCGPGGILRAPHRGQMSREILETLAGEVTVSLTGPRGEPLFAGTGAPAEMERVEGIDA